MMYFILCLTFHLTSGSKDFFTCTLQCALHRTVFESVESGRLWELDGLQGGPIDHGPIESSDWLDAARPTIQQRMQKYAEGEIHFNLLAVCQDKLIKLNQELEKFKVESNEFMKK